MGKQQNSSLYSSDQINAPVYSRPTAISGTDLMRAEGRFNALVKGKIRSNYHMKSREIEVYNPSSEAIPYRLSSMNGSFEPSHGCLRPGERILLKPETTKGEKVMIMTLFFKNGEMAVYGAYSELASGTDLYSSTEYTIARAGLKPPTVPKAILRELQRKQAKIALLN